MKWINANLLGDIESLKGKIKGVVEDFTSPDVMLEDMQIEDIYYYIAEDIVDAINRHARDFRTGPTLEFNMKLGAINIPETIIEKLSGEEINEIFWEEVSLRMQMFGEEILEKYDWAYEVGQTGRSGGWFIIIPAGDLVSYADKLFNMYEELDFMKQNIEDNENIEYDFNLLKEDIKTVLSEFKEKSQKFVNDLISIKEEVKETVKNFEKDIGDKDFWEQII